jgi:hypothetical protein
LRPHGCTESNSAVHRRQSTIRDASASPTVADCGRTISRRQKLISVRWWCILTFCLTNGVHPTCRFLLSLQYVLPIWNAFSAPLEAFVLSFHGNRMIAKSVIGVKFRQKQTSAPLSATENAPWLVTMREPESPLAFLGPCTRPPLACRRARGLDRSTFPRVLRVQAVHRVLSSSCEWRYGRTSHDHVGVVHGLMPCLAIRSAARACKV